jgi:SAM-dependent methyltransferase
VPLWLTAFLAAAGLLAAWKLAHLAALAAVLGRTRGALYVRTSRRRVAAFLEAAPLEPGQLLLDLGCGDGRVLVAARRRYGARGLGYEVNPLAYLRARLAVAGRPGLTVRLADFRRARLPRADVVFCYLFPDVMAEVGRKLAAELAPGARVASANFPVPGWSAEQVLRPAGALHHDPIYLYRLPECLPAAQMPLARRAREGLSSGP